MNACEWSLFLNALSISIAKNKSPDDLAFLSLVFSQLSTTLALLSYTPPSCGDSDSTTTLSGNPDANAAIL